MPRKSPRLRHGLAILPLLLAACASAPTRTASQPNPQDPWEGFNRSMYQFNSKIDTYALRPLAKGYENVTPKPVRSGVSNFFANLKLPLSIANDLLQLKFGHAATDTGRFLVNSLVGLGGFLDPARHMGLKAHDEDFGQTLGYWGVPSGPYLVLPFLGPSTVRDTGGDLGNWQFDPVYYYRATPERYQVEGLRLVNSRAKLLGLDEQLQKAYDPYAFMRDSYLQHRKYEVYDGHPPIEYPDYDEMYQESNEDSGGTAGQAPQAGESDSDAQPAQPPKQSKGGDDDQSNK